VPAGRSICAFGADGGSSLVIVTADGRYFKASFEKGSEMEQVEVAPLLRGPGGGSEGGRGGAGTAGGESASEGGGSTAGGGGGK